MRNEEIHIKLYWLNPLFTCEPLLHEMFSFNHLMLSSPMVLGEKAKEEIM